MKCAVCGAEKMEVEDTRHKGGEVHRTRKCVECPAKFTTLERIQALKTRKRRK